MELDPRDVVTGLFAIVGSYLWYDKTRITSRLDTMEKELHQAITKQNVLEAKLDGIKDILDIRFDMVMQALEHKKDD